MDEYIRREDASDAVIKHLQLDYEYAWGVREAINTLPSADVVPVCRCKDCKYFYEDIGICDNPDALVYPTADSFCSYGEREE